MTTRRPRAMVLMAQHSYDLLFDQTRRQRLARLAGVPEDACVPDVLHPRLAPMLEGVEVLVTSWGAPPLDERRLLLLPNLRAVFHAAGSVRPLVSEALWDRDILVTSAADANAVPVAEFSLGAILLAGKRALVHVKEEGSPTPPSARLGNLDRTVGVVGFSRIGRRLVHMLRPFDGLHVLVADPFASRTDVEDAGARHVSLHEMLPFVDILSLHAPSLPSTRGMIGVAELSMLRDGATVINTARGALLDHDALLAECRGGRLDAILDVTDPEPLPPDAELRRLPNVALTPHVAGSLGTETRRLADAALAELEAYAAGRPPLYPVTRAEMSRVA